MQIIGHRIDENGFYKEEVAVDSDKIPNDVIIINWGATVRPKWDGEKWVEGFVDGDMTPISEETHQPTDIELMKKTLTDLSYDLMMNGVI